MDDGMLVKFKAEITINAGMTYIFKFEDEVIISDSISKRDDDVIVECCIEQARESFCNHLVDDKVITVSEFPDIEREATFNILSYTIYK